MAVYKSIFSKQKNAEDKNDNMFDITIIPRFINGVNNKSKTKIVGKLSYDKPVAYTINSEWESGILNSIVSSLTKKNFISGFDQSSAGAMAANLGFGVGTTGMTTKKIFMGSSGLDFTFGMKVINDGSKDSNPFFKTISDIQQLSLPQVSDNSTSSEDAAAVIDKFKSEEKDNTVKSNETDQPKDNNIADVIAEQAVAKKGGLASRLYAEVGTLSEIKKGLDITASPSDFTIIIGNHFALTNAIMTSLQINYSSAKTVNGPLYCDIDMQISLRYNPKITINNGLAQIDNVFVGVNQVDQMIKDIDYDK